MMKWNQAGNQFCFVFLEKRCSQRWIGRSALSGSAGLAEVQLVVSSAFDDYFPLGTRRIIYFTVLLKFGVATYLPWPPRCEQKCCASLRGGSFKSQDTIPTAPFPPLGEMETRIEAKPLLAWLTEWVWQVELSANLLWTCGVSTRNFCYARPPRFWSCSACSDWLSAWGSGHGHWIRLT